MVKQKHKSLVIIFCNILHLYCIKGIKDVIKSILSFLKIDCFHFRLFYKGTFQIFASAKIEKRLTTISARFISGLKVTLVNQVYTHDGPFTWTLCLCLIALCFFSWTLFITIPHFVIFANSFHLSTAVLLSSPRETN